MMTEDITPNPIAVFTGSQAGPAKPTKTFDYAVSWRKNAIDLGARISTAHENEAR